MFLYGYPGKIGRENPITNDEFKMYGDAGVIVKSETDCISYNITTTKGQSGSPVFHEINGEYFVIGIHCQ